MTALAIITPTWNTQEWVERMQQALPQIEVRGAPNLGRIEDIVYAACWLPPKGALASLPNLKLIFSLGAGVDAILRDETVPTHIPLVRVVDPDLTSRMSEYVVMQVLMHHRETQRLAQNQAKKKWDSFATHPAKAFRVGLMGLGVLGQDAARKLRLMGYQLRGWSRKPKQVEGMDCFAGEAQLERFLQGTDILVCLLPATPATAGIINRSLLKKLSRNGPFGAPILINAGRGRLQIEDDILACLDDGSLRAASLDVFQNEPLPQTSPLWLHPKVTISPHNAADSDPMAICAYIRDAIQQFEYTRKIINRIDRSIGY